jgi:hypothetical protein
VKSCARRNGFREKSDDRRCDHGQLDGHRVRLRGYAVANPPIEGGILLARWEYTDPHEVDETDIPFDAVAVVWRKSINVPLVPRRPTVEGTPRLGNRDVGPVIVSITLEDATPVLPNATSR